MPPINIIIGSLLILLAFFGGAMATFHNIHNAQGPRERAYAIRVSVYCWLLVAAMFTALAFTEGSVRKYVMIGCFVIFPVFIYRWSIRHQLLRLLDQRESDEQEQG